MQRPISLVLALCSVSACAASGASRASKPHTEMQHAAKATPAPASSPPAAKPVQAEHLKPAEEGVPLPARVEAGEISRAALNAVLSAGIGRFLQRLRAEPQLEQGRFVGWRLITLFDYDPQLRAGVLRPGDTVMRVNGQSIERPEEFKRVWDGLATERDLVLQVRRAGKKSELRYRIID